jgi:hypothetical protein
MTPTAAGDTPAPLYPLYRESRPAHAIRAGVAAGDRARYSLLMRFWWGPHNRRMWAREAEEAVDWSPVPERGYPRCALCADAGPWGLTQLLSDHQSAHIPALRGPQGQDGWCIDEDIAVLVAGLNSLGLETGSSCQGHAPDEGCGGEVCICNYDSTCGWAYLSFGPGVIEQFLAATNAARVPVTPDSGWLGRQLRWTAVRFDREHIPALTALFPHPDGDWAPVPVNYDR